MHWKILREPFPINTWQWYRLRGIGFGLFVFLFLFLFQPFSLNLLILKSYYMLPWCMVRLPAPLFYAVDGYLVNG